jgi:diguanylate cyclase (GGDEF)-like protein/PAS domain S-box-containing protein
MADQTDILQAALAVLEEAIAVLDADSRVLFWNSAATAITGYRSADLLRRVFPADLYQVDARHLALVESRNRLAAGTNSAPNATGKPVLVNLRHSQGHLLPGMLRRTPLRDEMGRRFGTLLRFHPVEEIDALPHGELSDEECEDNQVEQSQAGIEDRLDEACQEWSENAVPFGVLWITIDQAAGLRKTHGRDAFEAMLGIVQRTLLHGLRPSEIMGRWGTNEFLVLCHERTPERVLAHAQHLVGLARTADFRWWGDRITLTVSVGAAQAANRDTLACLLKRAQEAMQESLYAGGNHVSFKHKSGQDIGNEESKDFGNKGEACSQS